MPGISISTHYRNENGLYRVKLYDMLASGDLEIQALMKNFTIKDEAQKFDESIIPKTLQLTFVSTNTEAWSALIEDLKTNNEERFFIEVDKLVGLGSYALEYRGRLVMDLLTISDEPFPDINIVATDGLTLLKGIKCTGIDFNDEEQWIVQADPFKTIISYLLNEIQTVQEFYLDSDDLWSATTNLRTNSSIYAADNNLFNIAHIKNYLREIDNLGTDNSKYCFEALKEILDRLFLRMRYDQGKYIIEGKELIMTDGDKYRYTYSKAGSLTGSFLMSALTPAVVLPQVGAARIALEGGEYQHEAGIKDVRIKTSGIKKIDAEYLNAEMVKVSTANFDNDYTFDNEAQLLVGEIYPDRDYKIIFTTQWWCKRFGFIPLPIPKLFFTYNITGYPEGGGSVDFGWEGGPITEAINIITSSDVDLDVNFQYTNNGYLGVREVTGLLTGNTNIMKIWANCEIKGYGPSDFIKSDIEKFWCKTSVRIVEVDETDIDYLEFYGSNNSKNAKSKVIELLAASESSSKTKIYLKASGGTVYQSDYLCRYKDTDSYELFEYALIRHILNYYSSNITKLDLNVTGPSRIYTGTLVEYRDKEYYVVKASYNYLTNISKLSMVKRNTAIGSGGIDIFLTKKDSSPHTYVANIYQNSNEFFSSHPVPGVWYKRYTGSGTTQTIPLNIPDLSDYTNDSINNAIKVYVSGVKLFNNETNTLTYQDNWKWDISLERFEFKNNLTGKRIEFEIDLNRLELEITS